jgi:hypothetical protein
MKVQERREKKKLPYQRVRVTNGRAGLNECKINEI